MYDIYACRDLYLVSVQLINQEHMHHCNNPLSIEHRIGNCIDRITSKSNNQKQTQSHTQTKSKPEYLKHAASFCVKKMPDITKYDENL